MDIKGFRFCCDVVLLNTLDNIIQSLLKISLIWCYQLNSNIKYIYINIKKSLFILIKWVIYIKNCNKHGLRWNRLTWSRVLQDRAWLGARQFAQLCKVRQERGKEKTMQGKDENLILRSSLASIPSLILCK